MEANGSGELNGNNAGDGGRAVLTILCVITVVSVLLFGAVDSGTLIILAILFSIALGVWFWKAFGLGSFEINLDMLQLPLVALFVWGLIQLLPFGSVNTPDGLTAVSVSSSISLDPYSTRFFLARLFLFIVFFAAFLTFFKGSSRQKTVAIALIGFGGLLAFYSILQRVEDPSSIYGVRQPGQAAPFGTYINRHHFAALMEMTLGLSAGLIFAGGLKRNRLPFVIAAAVIMAISIVLTGSRGALLGVIASFVSVASLSFFNRKTDQQRVLSPILVAALCGLFLIVIAGLVVFLGESDTLLRSTGVVVAGSDFSTGRKEFWKVAGKIFLDHPMIGVGYEAFGVAFSKYDPSSGLFRVEQAHNDYLQMLADGGIVAFACVVGFIYLLARKSLHTIRETSDGFPRGASIGAFAGCVAMIVHSFVDFPLRTTANGFVFLMLAGIAVTPIVKHSRRRRKLTDQRTET
jgi:O-antigen ligase